MVNRTRPPVPDPRKGQHLLWIPVDGEPARVGSSWRNDAEINAIGRWIVANASSLQAEHGRPLDEVLAVITPLGAQAKALTARLRKGLARFVPPEALRKMTIGTVHSLQGAERPIVLLSLVQHRGYFADSGGGRLMNVAASRAKEQFIVFGDPSVTASGTGPVAMLAKRASMVEREAEPA